MQTLAAQRFAAGKQPPAVPTAASGLHLHYTALPRIVVKHYAVVIIVIYV